VAGNLELVSAAYHPVSDVLNDTRIGVTDALGSKHLPHQLASVSESRWPQRNPLPLAKPIIQDMGAIPQAIKGPGNDNCTTTDWRQSHRRAQQIDQKTLRLCLAGEPLHVIDKEDIGTKEGIEGARAFTPNFLEDCRDEPLGGDQYGHRSLPLRLQALMQAIQKVGLSRPTTAMNDYRILDHFATAESREQAEGPLLLLVRPNMIFKIVLSLARSHMPLVWSLSIRSRRCFRNSKIAV